MNRINLPPEALADTDIERIKARIRGRRFVLFEFLQVVNRTVQLGAVCGLVGGVLGFLHELLPFFKQGALPSLSTIAEAGFTSALLGAVLGPGGALGLLLVTYGLFHFFRPVYVAVFHSLADFEREFGKEPPRSRMR
jgi:hypothetical protein